jgi:membrane associated rhomboid family serine protease
VFVILYGALELYLGVTGTAPGIAHFAHLGGMVGGLLMIINRRGRWRR